MSLVKLHSGSVDNLSKLARIVAYQIAEFLLRSADYNKALFYQPILYLGRL